MKAIWKNVIVADSQSTIQLEGNHFFPRKSVKMALLAPSEERTCCPWKGEAIYFDVVVKGDRNPAAAWSFEKPRSDAENIEKYIAFWKGIKIEP